MRNISKESRAVFGDQTLLPCVILAAFPNIVFY